MQQSRVNVRRVTGAAVVELVGEHDVSTVASVAEALERIGPEDARIVDLSAATFIDSSILSALVGACDGELSVGAIVGALSQLLEADEVALTAELLPQVRELVTTGVLRA